MGFGVVPGNKPACRAASGCLLPGAAHFVASAPRPGRRYWRACERINTAGRGTRPLFDMGNAATASCLLNKLSEHRITEELVDSKVLLKSAYSEVDQPIGKRTPDHWSERVSLKAVLFLSLGLWAAIWEAVGWLASAVFR
jgi:hypothetical protein